MPDYKRPPIIEAVLEFQFESELKEDSIRKVASKLSQEYTSVETEIDVSAQFEYATKKTSFKERFLGLKLSTPDRSKVILARRGSIGFAELAPYSGWGEFSTRAHEIWPRWQKSIGPQRISRIGLRFINRLDIPIDNNSNLTPATYLNILPSIPSLGVDHIDFYAMQIQKPFGAEGLHLTINTRLVPSPVPMSNSILLDVDLYTTTDIPSRDDELWTKLASMRVHKNAIFEACITDAARELFSR